MSFSAETSLIIDSLESSAQLSNLIMIKIHILSQHISDSEFTEEEAAAAVARSFLITTAVTSSIKKKRVHNLNISTTTCSDLLIELLSSFSSNLMMISETDFLSLIERYLFLIISSFQNQRSKVQSSFIIIIK